MNRRNRQRVRAARLHGPVRESDVWLIERPLPQREPGQFLARTLCFGVAAVLRGYMLDTDEFARPLADGSDVVERLRPLPTLCRS